MSLRRSPFPLLLLALPACSFFLDLPSVPSADGGEDASTLQPDGSSAAVDAASDASALPDGTVGTNDGGSSGGDGGADASSLDGGHDGNAADAACTSSCTKGATECGDGGSYTCSELSNGCYAWKLASACGPHEACLLPPDGGMASCTCASTTCNGVGTVCTSQTAIAPCLLDSNSCIYLGDAAACPVNASACGGAAPDAACAATCVSTCDAGAISCSTGGYVTCTLQDSGCYDYTTTAVACASTRQTCQGGAGAASCVCATDPTCQGATDYCVASGTEVASCAQDDGGCWYQQAGLETCANGACYGAPGAAECCVNQCDAGSVCVTPGISSCAVQSNGCRAYGAGAACTGGSSCTGNPGVAACTCATGETWCTTLCSNLQTDNANCGTCGNSCASPATCSLGRCVQTVVPTLGQPRKLAVGGSNLYWTAWGGGTDGGLGMAPTTGGGGTTVAGGENEATDVTTDTTYVYWTVWGTGAVMRATLAGGAVTTIVSGQSQVNMITTNGSSLYWTTLGGNVVSSTINGANVKTIASGQDYPMGIAIDTFDVYWAANGAGTVVKAPLAGGTASTIFAGSTLTSAPFFVEVGSNAIYWDDNVANTLVKAQLDGGALQTLASDQIALGPIFLDGTNLYWSSNAQLLKVQTSGTGLSTIASTTNALYGIATDTTSVYWVNNSPNGFIAKATPK